MTDSGPPCTENGHMPKHEQIDSDHHYTARANTTNLFNSEDFVSQIRESRKKEKTGNHNKSKDKIILKAAFRFFPLCF